MKQNQNSMELYLIDGTLNQIHLYATDTRQLPAPLIETKLVFPFLASEVQLCFPVANTIKSYSSEKGWEIESNGTHLSPRLYFALIMIQFKSTFK